MIFAQRPKFFANCTTRDGLAGACVADELLDCLVVGRHTPGPELVLDGADRICLRAVERNLYVAELILQLPHKVFHPRFVELELNHDDPPL
jgi:hypothetical protein